MYFRTTNVTPKIFKNPFRIFIGIVLNLQLNLGRMDVLIIFSINLQKHCLVYSKHYINGILLVISENGLGLKKILF